MADVSLNESDEVTIADSAGVNKLTVNTDGSINAQDHAAYKAEAKQFYWCSFAFNLASTGEKTALYFRNPSASGKVVKIVDLTIGLTNTVGSMAIVRMYANPTTSANGTALTALPGYIGGSQAASVALLSSGPTVSANGSLYLAEHVSGGTNGTGTREVDLAECILLAAGNSLLLTGDPDGTNRNLLVTITWVEI
jgi:hypothetical protein